MLNVRGGDLSSVSDVFPATRCGLWEGEQARGHRGSRLARSPAGAGGPRRKRLGVA